MLRQPDQVAARPDGQHRSDEQGSIIVAVMIIMIVVLLSSALFVRVIGSSLLVLTRQDTSSSLAAAEAGIADALFRIDNGATATFCVSPTVSDCDHTPVPAAPGGSAPSVSYEATVNSSATTWTIDAVGSYRNMSSGVQQILTRTTKYPFALFGDSDLTFNGSAPAGFGTYDSGGAAGSENTSAAVSIGSNGTITCSGGLGTNVTSYYVQGVGGAGSSCGTSTPVTSTFPYTVPQVPPSPVPSACPVDTSGKVNVSSLLGGTYLCTTPITMPGNLSVTGPVSLYIMLDPSMYNASTSALTIAGSADINYSPSPAALPDATQLQIFSNSNGTIGNSNGSGTYTFGGIIDAPNASLTGDGCKSTYYGALVINTFTCNGGGGGHLQVYYQNQLHQLYGAWVPSAYTQVAPSAVVIH